MKATEQMIDVAYEAALVATTTELANNSGCVNYRTVIETALNEALAVMAQQPVATVAPTEIQYSVSCTEDGTEWGGVHGPYPKLSQAMAHSGMDESYYLIKHNLDGSVVPLFRWNDDETKWQKY